MSNTANQLEWLHAIEHKDQPCTIKAVHGYTCSMEALGHLWIRRVFVSHGPSLADPTGSLAGKRQAVWETRYNVLDLDAPEAIDTAAGEP